MKFLVVTVLNSCNTGAFLQAEALKKVLSRYGEVYFLEVGARNFVKPLLASSFGHLRNMNIPGLFFEVKKLRNYLSLQKKAFKTIGMEQVSQEGFDAIIFGSDEIWNISLGEKTFGPVFWGEGINGVKISYAPSVSDSKPEDFEKWGKAEAYLSEFHAVSVRDSHSKSIIQQYCKAPVAQVVDPTLLLKYKAPKKSRKKKNIALYAYKAETLTMAEEVARIKNMDIESLTSPRRFEKGFTDRPTDLFYRYRDAEFVITDTFHGTVFAIIHNVQFVANARDRVKVLKLLEEYGLSDRNATGLTPKEAAALLDKKIDYDRVNMLWELKRKESLSFLKNSLGV